MGLDVAGRYRYPAPNYAWLALSAEEILDPEQSIVDAHHHLWTEPGNHYLMDDLLADLATGHRIAATVFVQCHHGYRESGPAHLRCVGETERIESMGRDARLRHPHLQPCAGIIGFADLLDSAMLDKVIEAHLSAAPTHFRGVRQSVARDSHFPDGIVIRPASPGMMSEAAFRNGLRTLAGHNLTFDAMLYHEQIRELTALAQDVPDATIILDHYGCPLGVGHYRGREHETFDLWRRDIKELSLCPNVSVKLGGMGMIITGAEHHLKPAPPTSQALAAAWRPYFDVCVEAFGPARCMFESNFPVDKAMYSYRVLWNAFKILARSLSPVEKSTLFMGTAARVYRLDLS
jgi:predicted TIM-barrel fold metal-dependent hydrolase